MLLGIRRRVALLAGAFVATIAAPAWAQEEVIATPPVTSGLDSGDTAWILISSAIVLMMTVPGLALFYGGLVRVKNVLSILMHCLATLAIVSVIWVLWGYSIAFGPDAGSGFFGDLSHFGLQGVSHEAGPDENIPPQLFMVFQLMFAAITPALIVGAFAERMKFSAFFLFIIAWSTFIYSPLAHWVWGPDGWLGARGALDFAGGTVVHISSGTAALIAAAMIGRRRGHGSQPMPPHNVPFTVAGAALLWVGWFGFNAGSALAADGTAVLAFVNTNTATSAAVLGWLFVEWIGRGKPTVLGAATGAVAGLVAITPACGFVTPMGSLLIGAVAGMLCYKACRWKEKLGYDDALDVVGVHGVGGTWGALATGLLAVEGGLFYAGNFDQFREQVIAVLATYAFVGVGTFVILGLVNSAVGLRVEAEDEEAGLDLSLHSETAYSTTPGSSVGERAPTQRAVAPRPPRVSVKPRVATVAGGSASTGRQPPVVAPTHREPPPVASAPEAAVGAPATEGGLGEGSRRFRLVVDGIDKGWLSRWWRDLCSQDLSKAPQAFRDIHPNLLSFEGGAYTFKGGDPAGTRDRLAYLLEIYGASDADVRVAELH